MTSKRRAIRGLRAETTWLIFGKGRFFEFPKTVPEFNLRGKLVTGKLHSVEQEAPGGTRTRDLPVSFRVLYPSELRELAATPRLLQEKAAWTESVSLSILFGI